MAGLLFIKMQGGIAMNWLIASDIHGSARWAEELVKRFDESGADRLLLLGDILYHGPRNALPEDYDPPKVAALLNARAERICCVRGNCDSEVDQMVLSFPITADYAWLPLESHLCFVTHGHVYSEEKLPRLSPGDLFLFGHIHIPRCEERGGITILNPGSVSIPKGGSERSYMKLFGSRFSWHRMDGTEYMHFQAE